MKHPFYLLLILTICSCNPNHDAKNYDELEKDATNVADVYNEDILLFNDDYEVEIIENGLYCDYISLSIDDVENYGHFYYGVNLEMNFENVEGVTLSESYSEFELRRSFLFTDLKGDTIDYLSYDDLDLFSEYHSEYEELYLNNFTEISSPLQEGKSYYFYSSYRDEYTRNEVTGKALITIDENPNIKSKNDGLKCSVAYVWDPEDETYVTNNTIEVGKAYYMGVHGLRGFKSKGESAAYGASIYIENERGDVLVAAEDLMMSESPKLKDLLFEEVNLEFILYDYYDMDIVHVTANFWDKIGGGSFSFQCDFEVIDEQYSFDYDY